MAYPINSPYAQFTDGNGDPLENGYIWIGTANLDAAANPITVYWDAAATIPAAQPIRTLNGFPVWNGSPANIYVTPTSYSIRVLNKNGSLVFSRPNVSDEIISSEYVTFLQAGSGAVIETVQTKLRQTVSVWDFMSEAMRADVLAGTKLVDTLPAFVAAMNSFTTIPDDFAYSFAGTVVVPPGQYYWSGTLVIDRNIKIVGSGAPAGNDQSITRIYVANNNNGIKTADYRDSPNNKQGTGMVIQDIAIFPKSAGGTTGSGVTMKTAARLIRVYANNWPDYGIEIEADVSAVPASNANGWYLDSCTTTSCGKSGLYVHGGDSNAGLAIAHNAIANGEWGIYDSSFLGNTYIGCHTAQNTSGAYKSDNPNARNVFLGCYSEGDQPTSVIALPSMVFGGIHAAGMNGSYFSGGTTAVQLSQKFHAPTFWLGYGQPLTSGSGIQFDDTDGTYSWTFEKAVGRWGYKWANLGTPGFINFYDRTAIVANGYARDLSGSNGAIGIGNYYAGNYAQMKYRGLDSVAPTTGTWLQGDMVTNSTPTELGTAGSKYVILGWCCVSGGTPGTWVQNRVLTGN